jgi:meso-butanediol dehydrogenase / (S,S)-butanediol dehydrogenase / diacetyl reductase
VGNIRANAVAPGTIETPMIHRLEQTFDPEDPAAGAEAPKSAAVLKRYGTVEEVAEMMLYVASDASAYCTAGVFWIEGGMSLFA